MFTSYFNSYRLLDMHKNLIYHNNAVGYFDAFMTFSYFWYVAGYPSELYYRGSAMWETLYGMICAYPIVIFIFVPVYYNLGITSVYQVTSTLQTRDFILSSMCSNFCLRHVKPENKLRYKMPQLI